MPTPLSCGFLFPILAATALAAFADDSVNLACKADQRVVGACFTVRGRLSNWNGNPTQRIWIIGTKRILGIRVDTVLPKTLEERMGDFDDVATGAFEVCPLTREKKGHMQIVCVASVSRVAVTKRKTNQPYHFRLGGTRD